MKKIKSNEKLYMIRTVFGGVEKKSFYKDISGVSSDLLTLVSKQNRYARFNADKQIAKLKDNVSIEGFGFILRAVELRNIQMFHERFGPIHISKKVTNEIEIFGPNGKAMLIEPLLKAAQAKGSNVRKKWMPWQRHAEGLPVPYTSKFRGGNGYSRNLHTFSEIKQNTLVVYEDGEVQTRSRRRPNCIPDAWDDQYRHKQKTWKEQHKGAKSWDRPHLKGK